ncbi:MAG: DUF2062 domain-containing protein [Desulfobacteraceae bacterium]|nr:DUF2062 domain-containing protein [Desulfobacteraceae bacterium]
MDKKNGFSEKIAPVKARLKQAYARFLKMRGDPAAIAYGLALGILIGMSPFIGAHTIIAIFVAAIFKWNKIAAALGVQITNVFTAPFIYPIIYMVGSTILGVSDINNLSGYLSINGALELIKNSPLILLDLSVGGLVLGLPLSFAAYWLTFQTIENYRKKIKPKLKKRRNMKKARKKKAKRKKRQKRKL